MEGDTLSDFIDDVCGESRLRVEDDLGDGFVRLRSSEAERRQAAQDIRSSEDVVIELLRNARDAGASRIYLADKYDVPAEEMAPRADELVTNTALAQMDDTVTGYTSCNREDGFVSKDENTVSYALAPVWILSTTYNGTPYTFIMNAQSGKFVGSLPVDKNKASMYTAAAFVVFVPILYFLIKMMFGSL